MSDRTASVLTAVVFSLIAFLIVGSVYARLHANDAVRLDREPYRPALEPSVN